MSAKGGRISIPMLIIAIIIILGWSIYRQYDAETGRFDQVALTSIYAVTFLASLFMLYHGYKRGR